MSKLSSSFFAVVLLLFLWLFSLCSFFLFAFILSLFTVVCVLKLRTRRLTTIWDCVSIFVRLICRKHFVETLHFSYPKRVVCVPKTHQTISSVVTRWNRKWKCRVSNYQWFSELYSQHLMCQLGWHSCSCKIIQTCFNTTSSCCKYPTNSPSLSLSL